MAYITLLLFCISTESMPVDGHSSSNRYEIDIPDDLFLQQSKELEAESTFIMANYRYVMGYDG